MIAAKFNFHNQKKEMAGREDEEKGQRRSTEEEIREPLIVPVKSGSGNNDDEDGHGRADKNNRKEERWMVYLSTFVAVCGSYEFGCCVSKQSFYSNA